VRPTCKQAAHGPRIRCGSDPHTLTECLKGTRKLIWPSLFKHKRHCNRNTQKHAIIAGNDKENAVTPLARTVVQATQLELVDCACGRTSTVPIRPFDVSAFTLVAPWPIIKAVSDFRTFRRICAFGDATTPSRGTIAIAFTHVRWIRAPSTRKSTLNGRIVHVWTGRNLIVEGTGEAGRAISKALARVTSTVPTEAERPHSVRHVFGDCIGSKANNHCEEHWHLRGLHH